jgi:hypothetical protein
MAAVAISSIFAALLLIWAACGGSFACFVSVIAPMVD